MRPWTELIEIAQGEGREARSATGKLIAAGASAVPDLIQAMRASDGSTKDLRNIILRMSDQGAVPAMLRLLDDENIDVMIVAFRFLGQSGSSLAFEALMGRLKDTDSIETKRYLAANALGELGDNRALPGLHKVAVDSFAARDFRLAISSAVAMAKLGSQEAAPQVVNLMLTTTDPVVRVEAAGALTYLFSPKIFIALQLALNDGDLEICRNGIDGLFLLGTNHAMSELVRRLESAPPGVSQYIIQRIGDISGRDLAEDEPIDAIRLWWERAKSQFAPQICYRLGRPIQVTDVIQLLEKSPSRRVAIMGELQIVLGQTFSYSKDVPIDEHAWEEMYERLKRWWSQGKDHFEPGGLYKFAVRQRLDELTGI